jgi:hypothetical protein
MNCLCCMTFIYLYNKCLALIILVDNHMVSCGNFFIIGALESYIVQCIFGLKACILINIQLLLFMNRCCKQLFKYLCVVFIIAYVLLVI